MLSRSRPIGMDGPGSIPWSELREYLDMFGVTDPDARASWVELITHMDLAFLEWHREQSKV